jgi:hypothetical protein
MVASRLTSAVRRFGFLAFHLGRVLGLAHGEVALRQRNLGVGGELRFLALLQRQRRLDLGVASGFGFADGGVALDLGRPPLAQRVQVPFFVADFLNRQDIDADPISPGRSPLRSSASAQSSDDRC